MRPYIGVTGFTSRYQVERALSVFDSATHALMVGVLMSSKTLAGHPNRWPMRFPHRANLDQIFVDDPRCLNLIHYSTDNPRDLPDELIAIESWSGAHLHGFQLNVRWPDPELVEDYRLRSRIESPVVVLQLGRRALSDVAGKPDELLHRLRTYGKLIDGVLIDPSGGLGDPFDPESALELLEVVSELWELRLGVAGGLSAATVGLLEPLRERFVDFAGLSCDAEGRIRDPETDRYLEAETAAYLQGVQRLFEHVRHLEATGTQGQWVCRCGWRSSVSGAGLPLGTTECDWREHLADIKEIIRLRAEGVI